MMVFHTRSAHEARRLARAVQTLTGNYSPPVLLGDGRYRLQDDKYSAEMAAALQSLLRHGVRANQCTPERVTAEMARLIKAGKIQTAGAGPVSSSRVTVSAVPRAEIEVPVSLQARPPAPEPPASRQPVGALSGDDLLAAFTPLPRAGRALPVSAPAPIAGGPIAEREIPQEPLVETLPDLERMTADEFAKRYGIVIRSPQRETEGLPGWTCKLIFVEEAEDPTIFPARQHKVMKAHVPAAAITEKLTVAGVLQHLRSQAEDLENHGERFEDWCTRHGMSTDSRMAERGWQQARRHLRDLKGFLGMALLRELIATRG